MNRKKIMEALRIAMSFVFLWAFADKAFGLGKATAKGSAWINGGSPTTGFLSGVTDSPFAEFFQSLAGLAVIDWLFMGALLVIGLTLLLKRYVALGAVVGIILMLLMYLAVFPPANNPLIDDHIIYLLVLALLVFEYGRLQKN